MIKTTVSTFISLTLLSLVAGCGGSGGSNGGAGNFGGPSPPPVGQLVTITENNAPAIAGVAAERVLEDTLVGTLTTTGIPVLSAGSSAATDMLRLSGGSLAAGMAAASLPTQDCAESGTVDVTFEVESPETINQGDEFSFEFDACNDGGGTVVSGGLAMTVIGFNGDPASELTFLQLGVQLNAFTVAEGGETVGAEGTITVAIDSRQPPFTTVSVSSEALTVTAGGVTETVFDLSVNTVENQGVIPTAVSVDTSFRLSTPRIGGDIIVGTTITLRSFGDAYPFNGGIMMTGDANSTITLIALDANSVRLEVDVDGDGATDATIDTTWTEIIEASEAA